MTADRGENRHSLDAIGRLHYAVYLALRDLGYPGFACQLQVWLDGRVDLEALRRGIGHLALRYPILTSRLVCEPGRKGEIYWEPRPVAACPLEVVTSDTAEESAVQRHAAFLMTRPIELGNGEALGFHLVRLPDERDVLIVHYDHTLIGDAHAVTLLLEELDALAGTPTREVRPAGPEPDEIEPFLRRHPRGRRWARALRLILAGIRRHPSLSLMPHAAAEPAYDGCRIALRVLDEGETAAFVDRVRRVCGFPNLSMALLASSFRAIHLASGAAADRRRRVAAGVGYSLRPADRDRALFRTFGSEMILDARLDELDDRDGLTRLLVSRAREQIRRGFDLGSLQLARVGSRQLQRVRAGFKNRMREMSFSYGYFKPVDATGRGVCGPGIERAYHLIMPWSPPGLTVSGSLCRERLHVAVTSCVQAIPEPLAEAFLDALIADLVA